jgi:uncharacterized protein YbaA (DUF1428 family)
MNESNATEIEKGIGSEVAQFVYQVPKKNHDAMMQLNKQFVDTMRKYGANQDEEVWLELIFYRVRKHRDEVDAKMRNDESMAPLFQQSVDLLTPGTSFIMGEFSRLKI